MSAQAARPAERGYHQDYIARIRYENSLPPPPGAPKLLNIPTEGLTYYTSAAFGSRLARQQPLNIEADAELGMPIDLVGMPGIFDGDESSIQAPLGIPPVNPKDRSLLRPLSELGKVKLTTGGHSFLRRTEYIGDAAKARAEANGGVPKATKSTTASKFKRPTDASKEDPINILRHVVKGFNVMSPEDTYTGPDSTANIQGATPSTAESEAWRRPKHPTKPDVTLIDSYPLLPDLDGLPDSGTYMIVKFMGNPTSKTAAHDPRVDVGLIQPIEKSNGDYSYEYYLPRTSDDAEQIKRQFDPRDPEHDSLELRSAVSKAGGATNRYDHHRTYDVHRSHSSVEQPYKEVALTLNDANVSNPSPANGNKGRSSAKAAYYYPIGTKTQLKPRRNKALVQLGLASQKTEDSTDRPDALDVLIRDADEDEDESRGLHRMELDPTISTGGT